MIGHQLLSEFKALWPIIGSKYLDMVRATIDTGLFPSSIKKGLIALDYLISEL
jgi:hypothetical protein